MVYTANVIEAVYRQLRHVTKTEEFFSSETAIMKLLFFAQRDVTAKWQRPMHDWNRILSELPIVYGERLKLDL